MYTPMMHTPDDVYSWRRVLRERDAGGGLTPIAPGNEHADCGLDAAYYYVSVDVIITTIIIIILIIIIIIIIIIMGITIMGPRAAASPPVNM